MKVEDRGQDDFRGLLAPRIPAEDGGSQCEIRRSSVPVHASGSQTLSAVQMLIPPAQCCSLFVRCSDDTNSAVREVRYCAHHPLVPASVLHVSQLRAAVTVMLQNGRVGTY